MRLLTKPGWGWDVTARIVILATTMAAIAGVASAGPRASPAAAVEGPETIAYGALRPSGLSAASSSRNLLVGGLVGALIDMSDGKQIVADNDLPDPAAPMARALAFELADLRGAAVDDRPLNLQRMKAGEIAAEGGPARYVVGTVTASRSFMWQSLAWSRYRVYYSAALNVVDTQTREIALAEVCKWNSDKNGGPMPEGAPTRNALLDDRAALLKAIFDKAGRACLAQFSASLRRWSPPAAVQRRDFAVQTTKAAPVSVLPPPPRQADLQMVERAPVRPVMAQPAPVRAELVPRPRIVEAVVQKPVAPAVIMAKAEPRPDPAPAFDYRLAAAYPERAPLPGFLVRP
ncbi:hypothetical protein E1H18_1019 [Caulobacter sp. RHG1]|nr:hypothetical protein [Caulobacter sp. RHG1]